MREQTCLDKIIKKFARLLGIEMFTLVQQLGIVVEIMRTFGQSIIQLGDGFEDDLQEPKNKRCQVAFVTGVVAELERIIILLQIFFYRVRQPIGNERVKLLREKEATDKPGKTAIAIIERVDIAKQIVCSSRAYEEVNRIVFNEIQNGLHCCLNSAFRQKALMDLLLCSICDRDRVLAENLTVGGIVRIFLDNFPQHKVIIDVSYILTGVEFDGGVLHQHGVLHDEAVKTPVTLFLLDLFQDLGDLTPGTIDTFNVIGEDDLIY